MFSKKYLGVTKFIRHYYPEFNPEKMIKRVMRKAASRGKSDPYYGKSSEQIQKQWNSTRKSGIVHHDNFDRYLKLNMSLDETKSLKRDSKTFRQFFDLVSLLRLRGFKLLETEMPLQSEKYMIRGTADAVFQCRSTKKLYVYDWKTTKNPLFQKIYRHPYQDSHGNGPLLHVPNDTFHKASLQLHLYRELLEHDNPDLEVGGCFLANFNESGPSFQHIEAIDVSYQVKGMLIDRLARLEHLSATNEDDTEEEEKIQN